MNTTTPNPYPAVKIGVVSVSDRASTGVYVDKGLPALQERLRRAPEKTAAARRVRSAHRPLPFLSPGAPLDGAARAAPCLYASRAPGQSPRKPPRPRRSALDR